MIRYHRICVFAGKAVFLYFERALYLCICRKRCICVFAGNAVFVYLQERLHLCICRERCICGEQAGAVLVAGGGALAPVQGGGVFLS